MGARQRPFSLGALLESVSSNAVANSSNNNTSASSNFGGISITTLLESFVPGYGPVHRFLLITIGFDVTILVSLIASLYLLQSLFIIIYKRTERFLSAYFISEITVASGDEIHLHLIAFLAQRNETSSSRRLMVETTVGNTDLDHATSDLDPVTDANGNIKWLNFADQEAKTQPRFTPAMGSHNFWHRGTYFILQRKQQTLLQGNNSTLRDSESLTLACFGLSTQPIKDLIDHVRAQYYKDINKKTVIRRPAGSNPNFRSRGSRGGWMKVSERPCRPLDTVVLDDDKKMEVLLDINEYLNPATAQWYANRGIPYRRGYLLHGPPGTGKTSLTFSLAGVFGLEIFVVSLLEPTLTEEELGLLFSTLPAKCIVLLEDIDTAGLAKRDIEPEIDSMRNSNGRRVGRIARSDKQESEGEIQSLNVEDLARALKQVNASEETKKSGISLSGLLNIIDGVASHEGRVLIMTTNKPEALDPALIRPGRVDHQVAFTNATQPQIEELFMRMYSNDTVRTFANEVASKSNTLALGRTDNMQKKMEREIISDQELTEIAASFATEIPDGVFSPAEIQGFLLKRKKEPRKAAEEVIAWIKEKQIRKDNGGFA